MNNEGILNNARLHTSTAIALEQVGAILSSLALVVEHLRDIDEQLGEQNDETPLSARVAATLVQLDVSSSALMLLKRNLEKLTTESWSRFEENVYADRSQ